MIVAVVTAIAITQREAKREQAAKEAEAKEAAKKDILVVGAGITGLLAALFCRAQGFSVTIVDAKSPEEFDATDSGIVWLAPTALRVLERLHERFPAELRKAACNSETLKFRRYKSGKTILSTRIDTCLAFTTADLHELLLGFTTSIFKLDTKIIEYHDAPEDLDGPLPHGRPYALAENGEKFYADMIVAADGKESLARTHVLASAGEDDPAEIDTKWNVTIGSLLAGELQKGHDKAGVEELFKSDSVDVWVGDEAYVSSITVGGKAGQEQEFLFTKYDLNADNKDGDLQAPGQPLVEGWDPRLAAAVRSAELLSEGIRINIRQKPSTLVSRKSRKLLLFGESGFTFPPHSPHLDLSYHVEAAATLAVCMRKAASVPLGLEIYTRLRAPRFKETMELAMERFNTITKSATGGELEANEVLWEIEVGEDGWWEHDAEKWAEKNFEGIIDELTAELLGRHKAMLEAQEKAAAEEKARLEEESRKAQYEDGESSSSESDGESSSSESDAGVKLDQEQSKVLEDGDNEKDVS